MSDSTRDVPQPQTRSTLKSTTHTDKIAKIEGIIIDDQDLKLQGTEQVSHEDSTRSTLKSTTNTTLHSKEDQIGSQTRSTPSSNADHRKECKEDQVQEIQKEQVNSGISTGSTLNSKLTEDPASSTTRSTLEFAQLEDTVILQTTEEEDLEFLDELNNFITNIFPIDNEIKETRKVYLNNDWQITDSIGNPDFIGLIENNSNVDLLSYITEKLPF